jgi:hypothetical protein
MIKRWRQDKVLIVLKLIDVLRLTWPSLASSRRRLPARSHG